MKRKAKTATRKENKKKKPTTEIMAHDNRNASGSLGLCKCYKQ